MIEQKKLELPITETSFGIFGKVEIETDLMDRFFDENKPCVSQLINRFTDSDEDSLIMKCRIVSSLDTTEEYISLEPKNYRNSGSLRMLETHTYFIKKSDKHFFGGNIGIYADHDLVSISRDLYAKARARAIEICNANHEYEFNKIVDLLRDNEIDELNDFVAWWDKLIGSERASGKKFFRQKQ